MLKFNKKKKIEAETCPKFRSQYFKVRKKFLLVLEPKPVDKPQFTGNNSNINREERNNRRNRDDNNDNR